MPEVTSPAEWERTSLAGLAEYINGFAFNESYWSAEGLPIVRIAQITGSQGIVDRFQGQLSDAYRLVDGDLIFSWSGTLAVVRWSGGPAWLNQHLFKVVPRKGLDRDLLFHVLQASVAEMDKRAHGSTMKHIKRGELREFRVSLPVGADEQRTVAQVLDTLDTTIRQTEAIIEKLKQVKQGLLHDLLTRGIDAKGELRPPQSQAPHLYRESRLGWIPMQWEVKRLCDFMAADITYGIVQAGPHVEGGIPYVRTGDMAGDRLMRASLLRTSRRIADSYRRSEVRAGDIVMAIRATVGKVLSVPQDLDGANLTQGTARLAPNRHTDAGFLLWAIRHQRAQESIQLEIKGTTFAEITLAALREVPLAAPIAIEEQRLIGERIATCEARMQNEQRQRGKLVTLKSGLMDDLLTGRVRVTSLI